MTTSFSQFSPLETKKKKWIQTLRNQAISTNKSIAQTNVQTVGVTKWNKNRRNPFTTDKKFRNVNHFLKWRFRAKFLSISSAPFFTNNQNRWRSTLIHWEQQRLHFPIRTHILANQISSCALKMVLGPYRKAISCHVIWLKFHWEKITKSYWIFWPSFFCSLFFHVEIAFFFWRYTLRKINWPPPPLSTEPSIFTPFKLIVSDCSVHCQCTFWLDFSFDHTFCTLSAIVACPSEHNNIH